MTYGRLGKTKGGVRVSRVAHRGRVSGWDARATKEPGKLYRSESGRWILLDTVSADTLEVEAPVS